MEQLEQKANLSDIERGLASVVPTNVFCGCADRFEPGNLLPQDLSYLSGIKSPNRAKQYSIGRTAARQALNRLDPAGKIRIEPLEKLESGLVNWPLNVAGSLSHSKDSAVAAVANNKFYKSLGLDLEFYREVNQATVFRIASREEIAVCNQIIKSELQAFFSIFSAKESIFKALYPLINRKFAFSAVSLCAATPINANELTDCAYSLEFQIVENLSRDFSASQSLKVQLFAAEYFALTLCAIPGVL